jgi:hypothetical protein
VGDYRVVVEGSGIVFDGYSEAEARRQFNQFMIHSRNKRSVTAGKRVTLFKEYNVLKEYHPPDRE